MVVNDQREGCRIGSGYGYRDVRWSTAVNPVTNLAVDEAAFKFGLQASLKSH